MQMLVLVSQFERLFNLSPALEEHIELIKLIP